MRIFASGSTTTNYPQVQNYDALPLASEQTGKIYIVQEPQGTWPVNRKRAGFYRSDGETWTRLGVAPTCEEIGADVVGSAATVQGNLDTHNTDEGNPHVVTAEQVGAMTYVDRGDPATWDFVQGDFITDGEWHELDLSSIVPEGVRTIHFIALIRDDIIGSLVQLREKGNVNPYTKFMIRTQTAGMTICGDGIISCDVNRKIEYYATATTWNQIILQVRGWFKE